MNPEQVKLIKEWYAAKQARQVAEDRERALRLAVQTEVFGFADGEEFCGTHRLDVEETEAGTVKAKLIGKLNYTIDASRINEVLDAIEAESAEGKFIADRIVRFKPDLSVSEYEKAPEKIRKQIAKVLTIKPGAPTLEIEFPKLKTSMP